MALYKKIFGVKIEGNAEFETRSLRSVEVKLSARSEIFLSSANSETDSRRNDHPCNGCSRNAASRLKFSYITQPHPYPREGKGGADRDGAQVKARTGRNVVKATARRMIAPGDPANRRRSPLSDWGGARLEAGGGTRRLTILLQPGGGRLGRSEAVGKGCEAGREFIGAIF